MSAGRPPMCTGMMAFVRGVIAASIFSGSRLCVPGSTSTKIGTAPTASAARPVAMKV